MKNYLKIMSIIILYASTCKQAYAYLDPVSISFLVQGIVGVVAAIIASVRSVREKISDYIKNIFKRK